MLIGLQTFTIRKVFQNEADIFNTLTFLKSIGINYLELAYVPFDLDFIKMLKHQLDNIDMKVISSQLKMNYIQSNFDEVIKIHQLLDIKYMAVSVIPFRRLLCGKRGLSKLAIELNNLGKKTKDKGIQLLFHHHNYEFIKFNKKMAFDLLLDNLNPEYVQILSDTYWVKKGGFDNLQFLEKYKRFIKALHLRGLKEKSDSDLKNSEIMIKEVIDYAIKHQFYYGVIEQNSKDPKKDIAISVEYLKDLNYKSLLNFNKNYLDKE